MKITSKARYGLIAMCDLARQYGKDNITARELAENQNCSLSYMEQLLALLLKAKLIQSSRGAKGGYKLERDPSEISMGEIIRTLEGPIGFTRCSTEGTGTCSKVTECDTQKFWKDLYEYTNSFLEETKLSDLINDSRRIPIEENIFR